MVMINTNKLTDLIKLFELEAVEVEDEANSYHVESDYLNLNTLYKALEFGYDFGYNGSIAHVHYWETV